MAKEVLNLVSGLSIEDPLGRLIRFCEHEYLYYDAVPKGEPNRVEAVDVLATVGINSRIARRGRSGTCTSGWRRTATRCSRGSRVMLIC